MEGINTEQVKRYLLANFSVLPKDVILLLIQSLPAKETLDLCTISKDFNGFCKQYKVLENKARQYILENAPLSEPLDNIIKQANAVARGQTTVYTYDFPNRTIKMGLEQSISSDFDSIIFQIKGSPPKKGTKLWLFGSISGINATFIELGLVYLSLNDLKQDLLNDNNRENGTMDSFFDTYLDNVQNKAPLIDRLVNDLARNGMLDDYILHEITLP